MSEKKAKEIRKKQKQPQVTQMIVAKFQNDGQVNVSGFPLDFNTAMATANTITKTIAHYFVKAAEEGRLKDGIAEKPRIILPGAKLN